MTKTFTNITHPNFRCSVGACPAVHRSEDGKTLRITGELYNPEGYCGLPPGIEADVDISADLVLASLGVNDLVEAAERAYSELMWAHEQDEYAHGSSGLRLVAQNLREAVNRIKGGA